MDGGTVAAPVRLFAPVRPPMPLYPLPEGTTMRSDGLLVGSDGVVQGSDEDMGYEPVFRESDPKHMHPDYAFDYPDAAGPIVHGPDPRMASHLMP